MGEGKGHPLPESDEARHKEIPESLAEVKGRGEEGREVVAVGRSPVEVEHRRPGGRRRLAPDERRAGDLLFAHGEGGRRVGGHPAVLARGLRWPPTGAPTLAACRPAARQLPQRPGGRPTAAGCVGSATACARRTAGPCRRATWRPSTSSC